MKTNRLMKRTNRIDRRTLLQTLGVTGVAGLAGCLSSGDDADDRNGNGNGDNIGESVGTAEITFLSETYTYDDASCEGSSTFPPENEMIRHRDVDDKLEFWVERYDPEESDTVEVYLGFPEGGANETIGEIEAYTAQTTVDDVEFELGAVRRDRFISSRQTT